MHTDLLECREVVLNRDSAIGELKVALSSSNEAIGVMMESESSMSQELAFRGAQIDEMTKALSKSEKRAKVWRGVAVGALIAIPVLLLMP